MPGFGVSPPTLPDLLIVFSTPWRIMMGSAIIEGVGVTREGSERAERAVQQGLSRCVAGYTMRGEMRARGGPPRHRGPHTYVKFFKSQLKTHFFVSGDDANSFAAVPKPPLPCGIRITPGF